MRSKLKRHLIVLPAVLLVAFTVSASACGSSGNSSTASEGKVRDGSYDQLVKTQPAHRMSYSPSRETINKWIDTWNEPGQLAFVYLKDAGKVTGYFIFQGPPVSMCAALTPTYKIQWDSDGNLLLPVPGVDGVWYSGAQCNQYYGIDASTGNYVEFSIGGTQNYQLTTQPLPSTGSLDPEAFTSINDVHKSGDKYVVDK